MPWEARSPAPLTIVMTARCGVKLPGPCISMLPSDPPLGRSTSRRMSPRELFVVFQDTRSWMPSRTPDRVKLGLPLVLVAWTPPRLCTRTSSPACTPEPVIVLGPRADGGGHRLIGPAVSAVWVRKRTAIVFPDSTQANPPFPASTRKDTTPLLGMARLQGPVPF